MQRSEARARLVRRVAPLALGAVLLGSGAYLVAKAFRPASGTGGVPTASAPVPIAKTTATTATSTAATSASSTAVGQPGNTTTRPSATWTIVPVKPVSRTVSFTTLSPPFGVQMAVDGASPIEVDRTKPFTIDDKAHSLVFTCRGDLCAPKTVAVVAGSSNVELSVELAVPPATLSVEGDPTHSYGITEIPTVNVAGGGEIDIPMTKGARSVHVFDRTDPVGPAQVVTLSPGKRVIATFRR
jgi:hypothetical protein